jgi:integrase/recombinase XerD
LRDGDGLKTIISPHKLRHFFIYLAKKPGIDDAFIQDFSRHESRKTLGIYSKLAIVDAQEAYNKLINKFQI